MNPLFLIALAAVAYFFLLKRRPTAPDPDRKPDGPLNGPPQILIESVPVDTDWSVPSDYYATAPGSQYDHEDVRRMYEEADFLGPVPPDINPAFIGRRDFTL